MKKFYSLFLILTALLCSGIVWGEDLTLTVMDDDWYKQDVPVDGYNLDGAQHNQFLLLSSELSAMNGSNIKVLKFYFDRTGHSWNNSSIPTVVFRLKEVENTSLSSLIAVDASFTQVYSGTIDFDFTNKVWSVTFSDPYSYNGGNLLIDIQTTPNNSNYVKKSGYNAMRYYTAQISGRAMKGSTAYDYCPKTTFTYEEAPAGSCAKPTAVTATQNTPVKATLSWTKAEGKDNYQYLFVEKDGTPDWTGIDAENTNSAELDGLTAGVEYDFYVRTYCDTEEQSDAVKKTFSTSCPAPTAPLVTDITTTTATLSWTAADGISNYQYIVVDRGAAEDWTSPTLVEGAVTTPLSGLTAGTKYDVYVRSYYSATAVSTSIKGQFQTPCNAMSVADLDGTFETETAGSGLMPNCWEAAASYEYSSTTYPYVRNGYSAHEGDKWLHFYGGTNAAKNIAVLPVFTEALNTLTISFYYKNYNTYSGYFSFGYYKNGVFTAYEGAANLERKTTYTYFEMAIPNVAEAEGARLAIQYAGGSYSYDAYIDDVTVTLTPSCTKPSGVTVSNIVYDGATIDWTENGSAEAWKVEYSTDNTNWTIANGGENVTTHPYDLRGLTTGTPYYVRVSAVCGVSDESPAVAAASTFTPECKRPGTPTIPAKTTTTATIQWTVNSGEDEWYLQYKKPADSEWSDAIHVTTNPYTLTGLESGTTYRVHVTAGCKEDYSAAAEFETECEAKTLPYNWGFDALTCWTLESCNEYSGLNSGAFRFRWTTTPPQYLISPELVASDKQVDVAFDYKVESSGNPETFIVGYSTSTKDLAAFTWGEAHTYSNTSYANYSERLPIGVKYIAIQCTSNNKYYLYIDNFTVTEYIAPSCAAPTALAVSEVSTNSAKVTWESEATEFALQYKKTSDADWTAATGTIASPFTLSGLTANETEYTVRVKAICGVGNESAWVELADPFITDCNPVALADFAKQEFGASVPECWKFSSAGGYDWAPSSTYKVSASYSMDYYAPTATENYADMITPSITLTEDANLKFQLRNNMSVTGEVYIVTSSATTKLLDLPSTSTSFAQQSIDLSDYTGETVKFIFRGHGANNYYHIYIDDVEVLAKPCDVPTALSKVESSSSVVLSWTDDAASEWTLRWREVGASDWNMVENLAVKNVTLTTTDLVFGKTYEAQVQAVCTATKSSDWSSLISFGLICGAAPTNLTVSNRTAEGATLTWTGVESAFALETSLDGENWESPVNVNATTYNLTGLNAGTTYYARVQNACGSDFSNIVEFTTWCDTKLSLPTEITIFSAIPACWEESPAGAVTIANSKLCFLGEGEKFIYLPQTNLDLNLLSATFTFSGSLEFGYIDAPNGDFHAFAAQPTSGVELDLAAEVAAPKYIAIRYNGASSMSQASISAISIRKTPTCLKPTGIDGTPGVGSATISWTASGSEEAWNLQYKTGSAADWTTVAVTENPYSLTGLEQGVTYKVRVQAACAGEDPSDWSDEASFITDCAAITALPWYADFNQDLSTCWTIHAESSSSYYIPAANTAMNQLKMDGGKDGASNNVLVLPAINADFAQAIISLEYKNGSTGANYAKLEIGYMTDKNDASTFQELEEEDQVVSFTEARVAINTVPAGKYLALRFAGANNNSDMTIKNLRVIENLTLAEATDNTATLVANNGKTLDVTIGRTFLCADYFNTICLPFDMSAEELAASPIASNDLWAFKYARVEGGELLIRIVEAESINAGEPYLISWPAGDNIVNPLFKNVTISASAGKTMGEENLKFVGTLKPETFAAHDDTKLFLYQNNTLYWWDGDAASSMNSFRAFFTVEGGANTMSIKHLPARIIKQDQTTTGIENGASLNNETIKLLENNQVVIIRNGVKYTIQGQVISK